MRLSVTELVAWAGDEAMGFSARGGRRAAWLGHTLHAAYQRGACEADPTARAEVPLRHAHPFADGWTVDLGGRCDLLRTADDGTWIVEELKTGRREPAAGSQRAGLFALQAKLYAWMIEAAEGEAVQAEWIWLPASGGDSNRHPVAYERADLQAEIAPTLERLREEVLRRQAVLVERRAAAPAIAFPFAARREGQREIETAVERALETGEQLLLEAPTGLGKTAAVLTPVVRHVLANDRRAFFASASTLQQRGSVELLRAIAPAKFPLAVRLRAKARMCATGTLLCREDLCDHAADYGRRRRVAEAVARCFDAGPVATPEAIFTSGTAATLCPFELSLDASDEAPVTLGDLNYLFDPVVALPAWSDPDLLGDAILVIDEAHQLPARAREAWSADLSSAVAREAADRAALGSAGVNHRQRELATRLAEWIESETFDALGPDTLEGTVLHEADDDTADRLLADIDACVAETLDVLDGQFAEGPHTAFLELAWKAFHWRDVPIGGFAHVAVREARAARLERWCLDPAPILARVFGAAAATVCLSATLSPFDLHARQLGIEPDRRRDERVQGTPPGERLRVVIEPRVSTRHADRNRQEPRIAKSLAAFLAEVPGNALILVSSFAKLERLVGLLPAGRHSTARQYPNDSEAERARLLERLRASDDIALFAIAGGALAEGVDTAGLGLCAVAVIGPCLPALDPRTQLLIEHLDEHASDGFEMAVALPGMTRVIQSVGRLLRRDEDRGVVVLYGQRFLRSPYCDWLPEAWSGGGPAEDLVDDPADVARAFFGDR